MRIVLVSACLVVLTAAAALAEEFVYVTNYRSGTLSIFPVEGQGVATLPLVGNAGAAPVQQVPGQNPQGAVAGLTVGGPVAVEPSPDGKLGYIVETGTPGALRVVDLHERRVAGSVPLEAEPFAVAVSSRGDEVWVANFGSDTVSLIDAAARRVVASIPVGHGPGGLALGSERSYVANTGGSTVSVIDRRARKVVREIEVGPVPFGLALSKTSLFVALSGAASVAVVNTDDDRVANTIAVGKGPVAVAASPDGKRVFVSNQADDSVSVIDAQAKRVMATIPVGREPFGLAMTRDGSRLAVANRSGNTVSIVDTDRNEVLRTVPVGTAPFGLAIGARSNEGACHCAIKPVRATSTWAAVAAALSTLAGRAWSRRRRRIEDSARAKSLN